MRQITKDACIRMLTAVLFMMTKIWKPPKCLPTGKFLNKLWDALGLHAPVKKD